MALTPFEFFSTWTVWRLTAASILDALLHPITLHTELHAVNLTHTRTVDTSGILPAPKSLRLSNLAWLPFSGIFFLYTSLTLRRNEAEFSCLETSTCTKPNPLQTWL